MDRTRTVATAIACMTGAALIGLAGPAAAQAPAKKPNDPYERADKTSNTYWDWVIRHAFFSVPVQQRIGKFLSTFKEYPPAQRPASFSIDQIMEKLQKSFDALTTQASK